MTAIEFISALLIVLVLIIVSFIAGLKLSGYYHKSALAEKEYALQKQYARLQARADADDPVAPYVPRQRVVLPPEFEDKLRETGRATASLNPNS